MLRATLLPILAGLSLALGCGGKSSKNGPSAPSDATGGGYSGTGGEVDHGSGGGNNPPEEASVWPMPHPPMSGLPNPASYTVTDEVVTDDVTGLMWQREGSPRDESFLELGDLGQVQSTRAESYCSALTLGGYEDWRLPTRIELVSLVDFERFDPAIDSEVFVDDWGASGSTVFLSSTQGPREQQLWAIDFESGESRGLGQRVRCVRPSAASADPAARFVVHEGESAGTVTDTWSGLVWQKTPSEQRFTFEDAQTECVALDLASGGFRAPSMKELQTLVDETKLTEPAIDTSVFDMPSDGGLFWTSSRSAANPEENGWYVVFGYGEVQSSSPPPPTNLLNEYYVRCVK